MSELKPIDIFITCWNRSNFTVKTLDYLQSRTQYPYRVVIIDNASTDGINGLVYGSGIDRNIHHVVKNLKNIGIHQSWNIAMGLADGEYFITTDNDIYVPQVDPDWLAQMVGFMDNNPDYAAIALQPHMYLGSSDPTPDPSGVTEVSHCGAVMRIMRTKCVREVGGWDKHYNANRNHEELTICSRLRDAGYKVGYASYLRAYHDWGDDDNWGYGEVHPSVHGHRIPGGSKFAEGGPGEIWPSPKEMKRHDSEFDTNTWQRKA